MNQIVKKQLGKTFGQQVLDAALSIPTGCVATYGDLAHAAGGTGQSARSVSGILGKYAQSGVSGIPWHRIVYSNGTVWLPTEQAQERIAMYAQEGIQITAGGKIIDFHQIRHIF